MKMYFKGSSGITDPVDMEGKQIIEGDLLTRDYADWKDYRQDQVPEHYKTEAFYLVKMKEDGSYYAESIDPIKDHAMGDDKRFYLHDFRFKHCKIINHVK